MHANTQDAPAHPTLLISSAFQRNYGQDLASTLGGRGDVLVQETGAGQPQMVTNGLIHAAYLSPDALHDTGFADTLLAQNALQWVHLCTAGADIAIARNLLERGVTITTSSGANAKPVAHSALAGLLALARGFPRFFRQQLDKQWQPLPRSSLPKDLDGTTATIIGMGPIGQEIARLCQALNMRTVGVRRTNTPTPYCDAVVSTSQLLSVLPQTDWLIIACPLTDETRHLINGDMLGALSSHACVINISRGAVMVENDLIAALQGGTIAGAYCDVFETEPLAAESPLWQLPNMIITPHNAGISHGFGRNAARYFMDNLARWQQGAPLINVVEQA